jgi:ATP-dependent DNA helicase RecG
MIRDDLSRLIAQGEGQQLDFKEETIKPGKLAETLVAFANAEGGLILLGVDDRGHVVGVSDLKRATDNVVEAITHCSPPLGIGLPQPVELASGEMVLVVEIPAQLPRVYHTHGRYLRRSGSMNMALDEAALRRLLYERGELSFEAEPVGEANPADLDQSKVAGFRQRYEDIYGRGLTLPDRDLLIAMGCLARDGHPTVAGLLLFGREIQRFFFEPHISIARYTRHGHKLRFSA